MTEPSEEVIERMADCLLKTHNTVTREEIINAWRVAQPFTSAAAGETPRTDAAERECNCTINGAVIRGLVTVEVCRQLERELTELREVSIAHPTERNASGWIPVGERLPESDYDVLVATKVSSKSMRACWLSNGQWENREDVDHFEQLDVTHWREYPAMPAQREE